MATKLMKIFSENVMLFIVTMILAIAIIGFTWKWTLYMVNINHADDSINALLKKELENTESISNAKSEDMSDCYESLTIEINNSRVYISNGEE